MSERPTIHVTNASSRKLHHGRVFNIMARPRHFERFEGNVDPFTPSGHSLRDVQSGRISLERYREHYDARCLAIFPNLAPGKLRTVLLQLDDTPVLTVEPGDTLVCACSKAAAAEGRCHRVWAARWLHEAGWRVVLDGREYHGPVIRPRGVRPSGAPMDPGEGLK